MQRTDRKARIERKWEEETLQRELFIVSKRLLATQLHEAVVTNLTKKLQLHREIFKYEVEIERLKARINKLK